MDIQSGDKTKIYANAYRPYRDLSKRPIVVASLGRCGSTELNTFCHMNLGDEFGHICKTHVYPDIISKEFKDPLVIFLFGSPLSIIKSLTTFAAGRKHYGDLVCQVDMTNGKEEKVSYTRSEMGGIDFLKSHAKNLLGEKYSNSIDVSTMVSEDVFHLEDMFDSFYSRQSFDMVTIRFETIWDNLDKLYNVLHLDPDLLRSPFPERRKRYADYVHENDTLLQTYGSLYRKVMSADDFRVWNKE